MIIIESIQEHFDFLVVEYNYQPLIQIESLPFERKYAYQNKANKRNVFFICYADGFVRVELEKIIDFESMTNERFQYNSFDIMKYCKNITNGRLGKKRFESPKNSNKSITDINTHNFILIVDILKNELQEMIQGVEWRYLGEYSPLDRLIIENFTFLEKQYNFTYIGCHIPHPADISHRYISENRLISIFPNRGNIDIMIGRTEKSLFSNKMQYRWNIFNITALYDKITHNRINDNDFLKVNPAQDNYLEAVKHNIDIFRNIMNTELHSILNGSDWRKFGEPNKK